MVFSEKVQCKDKPENDRNTKFIPLISPSQYAKINSCTKGHLKKVVSAFLLAEFSNIV